MLPVLCVRSRCLQFVGAEDSSYAYAYSLAKDSVYLGVSGHLATISSYEENKCVSLLTTCDRAWIGIVKQVLRASCVFTCACSAPLVVSLALRSRLQGSTWRFSDGPENQQSVNTAFWADGALATASVSATYATMDEGDCRGNVRLGQWIPCTNDCTGGSVSAHEQPRA